MLVSELYMYQNTRCNNKYTGPVEFHTNTNIFAHNDTMKPSHLREDSLHSWSLNFISLTAFEFLFMGSKKSYCFPHDSTQFAHQIQYFLPVTSTIRQTLCWCSDQGE